MAKRKPKPNAELDLHSARQQGESREGLRKRIASLEKQLAESDERYERLKHAKFDLKPAGKATLKKVAFARFILTDTHGVKADKPALQAILSDMQSIQPQHIILLGDIVDCGGFLSAHGVTGYIDEWGYSYEEDIAAGNTLLDRIQATCPKAVIEYVQGNHEFRVERWAVDQGVKTGSKRNAEYLLKKHAPRYELHLQERGIAHYRMAEKYDGLHVRGAIKRGACVFIHTALRRGGGQQSAQKHAHKIGANVVFGHIHRSESKLIRTAAGGIRGAWCPGCVCEIAPYWMHTDITDWVHGYGLQWVNKDDSFHHQNVVVLDGKSMVGRFLGKG